MKRVYLTIYGMLAALFFIGTVSWAQSKKNGPQPIRYNYKKLAQDRTSDLYNPKIIWPEDNVMERYEFEINRLKDPSTGEIPENIREKELKYVLSNKSGMQTLPRPVKYGANMSAMPGDQTSDWVNRGPYNVGGRTRALAIDLDNENILFAGGVSGGMWKSTNRGKTWKRVTKGDDHPSVTDIEQDPRKGMHHIWYYSTGERLGASESARNNSGFYQGNGIYKSTNNGETWDILDFTKNTTPQSFDNAFDLIFGIEINPKNGDLYVATFYGIFRSKDGGNTFEEVLESDFDNFVDIHISKSGIIYTSLDSNAPKSGLSMAGQY